MKGFDEMKINFLTGVFFCFGIYFVLVLFDIYALNREHNNGSASIFLTIVFFVVIAVWGGGRIKDENEKDDK